MATEKIVDSQLEEVILQALRTMPDGILSVTKRNDSIISVEIDETRRKINLVERDKVQSRPDGE